MLGSSTGEGVGAEELGEDVPVGGRVASSCEMLLREGVGAGESNGLTSVLHKDGGVNARALGEHGGSKLGGGVVLNIFGLSTSVSYPLKSPGVVSFTLELLDEGPQRKGRGRR